MHMFNISLFHESGFMAFSSEGNMTHGHSTLFCLHLELSHDGQVVADTSLVNRAEICSLGFYSTMCGVFFYEERQIKYVCLGVGEGGGEGENMVDGCPFSLILVCAWFQFF